MSSKKNNDKHSSEMHPWLPCGEWEGFYCYHNNAAQHKMFFELFFSNAIVSGSGIDDVAAFTWEGHYCLETCKAALTKHYPTHKVHYKGDIDENGIWGLWELVVHYPQLSQNVVDIMKQTFKNEITGGFHIWPKKSEQKSNSRQMETQKESQKLKELFLESFV